MAWIAIEQSLPLSYYRYLRTSSLSQAPDADQLPAATEPQKVSIIISPDSTEDLDGDNEHREPDDTRFDEAAEPLKKSFE